MIQSDEAVERIRALVETWCDRRCLRALRYVLQGFPLTSPLTDGWGELKIALENVRAFAREELGNQELETINELIRSIDRIVNRSGTQV
jgi:hypothetical protein